MMLAAIVTALAAAYLGVMLFALARTTPAYRHFTHTISELGGTGSRHQRLVGYGVFLPVGLAMLLVAGLTLPISRDIAGLALCIAIGYVGAAFYPCDPGSPMSGSSRQALHNLAGAFEYVGGGVALMSIARDLGQPYRIAGVIVLATAIGLSIVPPHAGRGAMQRIAELCLFGALGLASYRSAA